MALVTELFMRATLAAARGTDFLPSEAGAIFSIRLWAGMVSRDNAAAGINPKVAVCDERKQDQLAVRCFCPLECFGVGRAT